MGTLLMTPRIPRSHRAHDSCTSSSSEPNQTAELPPAVPQWGVRKRAGCHIDGPHPLLARRRAGVRSPGALEERGAKPACGGTGVVHSLL